MAGKGAEGASLSTDIAGRSRDAKGVRPTPVVRPLKVTLSGTVQVEFELTLEQENIVRHMVLRVEFPDEARSMLESSTWGRGINIHEAVTTLGMNFLTAYGVSSIGAADADGVRRSARTVRVPLNYLRSNLASVFAKVS